MKRVGCLEKLYPARGMRVRGMRARGTNTRGEQVHCLINRGKTLSQRWHTCTLQAVTGLPHVGLRSAKVGVTVRVLSCFIDGHEEWSWSNAFSVFNTRLRMFRIAVGNKSVII